MNGSMIIYLFKAYAPEIDEVHVETIKGLNAIYTLIENLQKNCRITEQTAKLFKENARR